MKNIIILTIITLFSLNLIGQVAYEHISRTAIYDLLDELANEKIIQINSVIKPYSRTFIAEKLLEAQGQSDRLSARQRKEIGFYLKDYRLEVETVTKGMKPLNLFPKKDHIATALDPLGLHYRDSLFALSVRPVWGIDYYFNENGSDFHRWGGAEGFAYVGKVFGAYSSLRDNHMEDRLINPLYFNQRQGAPPKGSTKGGIDYSEARGGMMFSWGWGSVGAVKDHAVWGNNYYGANILSGRTPSFAHLKLHLKPVKWFEFNYIHGWLVSEVVDSSRSHWEGDRYRAVFYDKYIAANMFTFIPVKHLNISLGNSIIYSDMGVHLAYLIPFLFYKSVDHTLNATYSSGQAGQNAQMFLDISSRNLKHTHLFLSVFIDELSVDRIGDPDRHNFISWKGGVRLSNWPVKDLMLTGEFTYTLPMVYQHNISTTTFESNRYNLGHYMRDNSNDIYLSLRYKPLRGLMVDLSWNLARHYNDYVYGNQPDPDENPVMQDLTWQRSRVALLARYEFLNNAYVFAGLAFNNEEGFDTDGQDAAYYLDRYSADFFHGNTTTFNVGFNVGF